MKLTKAQRRVNRQRQSKLNLERQQAKEAQPAKRKHPAAYTSQPPMPGFGIDIIAAALIVAGHSRLLKRAGKTERPARSALEGE